MKLPKIGETVTFVRPKDNRKELKMRGKVIRHDQSKSAPTAIIEAGAVTLEEIGIRKYIK